MPDSNAGSKETLPDGLAALMARAGSARGPAPVERWDPPYCGEIDMRIAADGRWFYEGGPIGRERLVRLFSTVLRRDEDGHHYLVTPVERVRITVEDAPFLAVELHADGDGRTQRLTFRTNVGDVVEVGPDNPLRFEDEPQTGGLKPYVRVRGRLDALLSRPLLYQLAEHFREETLDGESVLGAWSNGAFFPARSGGGVIAGDTLPHTGEEVR